MTTNYKDLLYGFNLETDIPNADADGELFGCATNIRLPVVEEDLETFRSPYGFQDSIRKGFRELTFAADFKSWNDGIIKVIADDLATRHTFTLYSDLRSTDGTAVQKVDTVAGTISKLDQGTLTDDGFQMVSVEMGVGRVRAYKCIIDGATLIDIDLDAGKFLTGGINHLASNRQNLGLA